MKMEPTKLPPQFVKGTPRRLEDLKAGESAWVDFLEMAVDPEYRCYIDPRAKLRSAGYGWGIRATRTEEGFEVFVPGGFRFQWEVGRYNPAAHSLYARYWPVVKLEYEERKAEK
jgi:hypothetical protein